jgi:hypothetical protein
VEGFSLSRSSNLSFARSCCLRQLNLGEWWVRVFLVDNKAVVCVRDVALDVLPADQVGRDAFDLQAQQLTQDCTDTPQADDCKHRVQSRRTMCDFAELG